MPEDTNMQAGESDKLNEWVRLTSSDGYDYLVRKKVALGSGTLRDMLNAESSFSEALSNTCPMNERGIIVEKLAEYLVYKSLYEGSKKNEDIPDFQERVFPEISLELLVAADYYDAFIYTNFMHTSLYEVLVLNLR
ncbi:POZ domain-containing protein [Earliella scabrosa]|nr:POZ domain-containing protein [Earliella scabrosa]